MKSLTIEAMDCLAYLAAPDLKCDGSEAVYTVMRADESGKRFVSEVRRIRTDAEGAAGELVASGSELAKYAPDGSRIACLRAANGVPQIWLWEEGELRQLTRLRHGVSDFSWLPDGQGLVWEAPLWPEELKTPFGEMTPDERAEWERQKALEPIVVEELIYKLDEVGLFDGSIHQLGVTYLDGTSRLLTKAPYEHRRPAASPDGKTVVYYGYPDGSVHRLRAQIFALDLRGDTEERQVTEEDYLIDSIPLLFDPLDAGGGRVTALTYVKKEGAFLQLPQCFDLETGQSAPLLEAECPSEEINNLVVGRNACGRETSPYVFSEDGKFFYYTALWKGSQRLYAYDRIEKAFACLSREGESIQAISAVQNDCLVYLKGTLSRPAELYAGRLPMPEKALAKNVPQEPAKGITQEPAKDTTQEPTKNMPQETAKATPQEPTALQEADSPECADSKEAFLLEHPLTDENAWLSEYDLPQAAPLDVPSTDGKAIIHGWYIKPAGLKEGQKAPAVLDIHGGPDCGYSSNFWFEFAYLAARGLAVVYCDPRGSVGYGAAYRQGDCAYGAEAQEDLLAFLDAVAKLGFIDRERCGVTGGSYGGYMTNRLISTTDRFAAAVTQRNLCNLATSYGTGDMGFVTGKEDFTTMSRMLKERVKSRTTTLRLVDRIRTPLLILHGTADYRCSFEQGEQLFIAMKERNPKVPVRFVAFPGENHGLTRTGRPAAQRAHLQEMADWFVKYLFEEKEEAR